MKILCLVQDYTNPNGKVAMHYVHTRNLYYQEHSIDVDVLSFSSEEDYVIDNVKVYTEQSILSKTIMSNYDLVISHAPNLRNHIRFLNENFEDINQIIFFFHGHEVLHKGSVYPKPYRFKNSIKLKLDGVLNDFYDRYKLRKWRNIISTYKSKANFIFVSNWMYRSFLESTKIDENIIKSKSHIIYNSIGRYFEENHYDKCGEKTFDFITIRNNLDGSKYAIDIVVSLAVHNPKYKFCLVGQGDFFNHFIKPDNLVWIDKNLSHDEVIYYLDKSRYALLPTRLDSQGVMACEIATYGIPLITSEIDVCQEIFDDFTNVGYIQNEEDVSVDLSKLMLELRPSSHKNNKFFKKQTVAKEVDLFKKIIKR